MKVVWQGYYNIQETNISEYASEYIGKEVSDNNKAGYEETSRMNELSTAPGETRYFK